MTGKQIERTIARIKDLHSKTETLINDVFSSCGEKLAIPKVNSTKPRMGKSGGMNKSELIRAHFAKHGLETRPRDVIEALSKNGIAVTAAHVSIEKHKLSGGSKPKKVKVEKTLRKSGDPLPAVVQSVLAKNKDGLKLSDLSDKVKEAGYQYSGKKGDEGLKQNVYQCLYSLAKEKHHPGYDGTDPVVLHDETSKRYMLNPNAKRSA
jgi:hypothetical protein